MKKLLLSILTLCCTIASCAPSEQETNSLWIEKNILNFEAEGGSQAVAIDANFDYVVLCQADWISYTRRSCGIDIVVSSSDEAVERISYVIITNNKYTMSDAIKIVQKAHIKPIATDGWAEMPAKVENANWEYGYHDKLPSNNKLRNYSFCFDKEKYCALWVAYPLHKCYTEGSGKRTDDWSFDPCCIDDKYEPDLNNSYYSQGGGSNTHSRGHQLPSADRLASNEDNATTFYFTNMTPQLQSLNGGTWASLEGNITKNWICSDTLYVVTGAHFEPGVNYDYAWDKKGTGKACAVPTHYYKVILRTKSGNSGKWVVNCSANELKCVGFWFDHAANAPRQTMSVAEIEKKTGLTFFTNVPNAPKSVYNASDWN